MILFDNRTIVHLQRAKCCEVSMFLDEKIIECKMIHTFYTDGRVLTETKVSLLQYKTGVEKEPVFLLRKNKTDLSSTPSACSHNYDETISHVSHFLISSVFTML